MPTNTAPNTALARTEPDSLETLLIRAQAFVDRKYIARADARQQETGLAYVEAERQDLAREIARFVTLEIAARTEPDSLSQALDSASLEALALDRQPNGYTASIFLGLDANGVGKWTERVWGASASDAIKKALAGVPVEQVPAPVLAPPPY